MSRANRRHEAASVTRSQLAAFSLLAALSPLIASSAAGAQEPEAPLAPPSSLPAPTLEPSALEPEEPGARTDPESAASDGPGSASGGRPSEGSLELAPSATPAPARVLYRIGPGMHPEWEGEEDAAPDVPFTVPGDVRSVGPALPEPDPEETPQARPFGVSLGVGFARLLGVENVDFVRVHQRFHARIPGADFLYLGAGASQLFAPIGVLAGGGPRVGMGATFCGASWVRCEGAAFVQPGVIGGDLLGVRFDLHAAFEARFFFPPLLEVVVDTGYSLLDGVSLFHVSAAAGLAF
jgi:hypothetical protein